MRKPFQAQHGVLIGRIDFDGNRVARLVNEADGMMVFAHRGARGHEPENTLRAFARALAMGARWLELDVFPVQDRLVVFHDLRLEGLTDGELVVTAGVRRIRDGQRVKLLDEGER